MVFARIWCHNDRHQMESPMIAFAKPVAHPADDSPVSSCCEPICSCCQLCKPDSYTVTITDMATGEVLTPRATFQARTPPSPS